MASRDRNDDTAGVQRHVIHFAATRAGDATCRYDTELQPQRVAASRRDTAADSIPNKNYRLSGMSPEQLRALPAAVPFDPIVPAAFGISRSAAYRALAAGQLPIKPLRLGRRLIVRRSDLLAALGLSDEPVTAQPEPPSGNPNHPWKDGQ